MLDNDLIFFKQQKISTNVPQEEGVWLEFVINHGQLKLTKKNDKNLTIKSPEKYTFAPFEKFTIEDEDIECEGIVNFYCSKHRYFPKKYGLGNVHSDILYSYHNYNLKDKINTVLDVGAGSCRNALYLALQGHEVTAIDINEGALNRASQIAQIEEINFKTQTQDLNQPINLENTYDLIISTVTLQFLNPESITNLLNDLNNVTNPQGYHLMVFPVQDERFNLPESFRFLPSPHEIEKFYQDLGYAIIEYKESVGQLHRLDANNRPIQGLFAYLLAQKI